MGKLRFTKAKSLSQEQWDSKLPELELENKHDFLEPRCYLLTKVPQVWKFFHTQIYTCTSFSHIILVVVTVLFNTTKIKTKKSKNSLLLYRAMHTNVFINTEQIEIP